MEHIAIWVLVNPLWITVSIATGTVLDYVSSWNFPTTPAPSAELRIARFAASRLMDSLRASPSAHRPRRDESRAS